MKFSIPESIKPYLKYLYAVIFAVIAGMLIAKKGIVIAAVFLIIPVVILYFAKFFENPKIGLWSAMVIAYIIPTFGRYAPFQAPLGLGVDFFLVMSLIVMLFKFWKKVDFTGAYNIVNFLMILWMAFIVLEIANPLAYSATAWFYAMRGIALYQLLIITLCFVLVRDRKDWYTFINLWMWFSLVAALWGFKQKLFGVDRFEQAWLDQGAATTHLLFGKLRIFGNFTDAGMYGAGMGHAAISAGILFLGPFSLRKRALYLTVALACAYAMLISGTRGAIAVPGAGGILYLIMIRNKRILIAGAAIMISVFSFLKFTTIGSGNYDIQRFRTALDSDDPSLNVRLQNREMLSIYLANKPIGTGVGTAGVWGERFSPGTWMASFPTDGLFTRIRAETGIVGHTIYVYSWLFILGYGIWRTWQYKDKERQYIAMASLSGYAGILAASYGNEVMTQMPEHFTTFIPLTFVFTMKYWNPDKDGDFDMPAEQKGNFFK
ncbi:MAG: O-antigen ligase domain-containing protein [Bacteroidetes bacterium]|nr:MAG: O-antigen ligase domain-containing protein [Bacteroidota bacterium]